MVMCHGDPTRASLRGSDVIKKQDLPTYIFTGGGRETEEGAAQSDWLTCRYTRLSHQTVAIKLL